MEENKSFEQIDENIGADAENNTESNIPELTAAEEPASEPVTEELAAEKPVTEEPATQPETVYPPKKDGGEYDDLGRYVFPDGSYYDIFGEYHPTHAQQTAESTYAFTWNPENSEQSSTESFSNNYEYNPEPDYTPEPIIFDEIPDKKKKHSAFKKTMIVMACVFGVFLTILIAALIYNLVDTHEDASKPQLSVNVTVSDKGPTSIEDGMASAEIIEQAKTSVVVITNQQKDGTVGLGSGFIISTDGYIVTNQHVIDNASRLTVDLYDGTSYDAKVIGSSARDDIAVIKISAKNLPAIVLAKSSDSYVGERVYAIGCPDSYDFAWTVTTGIISHTDRQVKVYDDDGNLEKTMNLIQTDTPVNHGNSGGPLINTRGEVVGIVTLRLSNNTGLGFAIPMDAALEIITALIEDGNANNIESSVSAPRPMMGITCIPVAADTYCKMDGNGYKVVDKAYADENPGECFYAAVTGIYVVSFDERYNAKDVLEIGDIIVSVDGNAAYSNSQLSYYLNNKKAGDTVTLKVYRNGGYMTVDLVLAAEIID